MMYWSLKLLIEIKTSSNITDAELREFDNKIEMIFRSSIMPMPTPGAGSRFDGRSPREMILTVEYNGSHNFNDLSVLLKLYFTSIEEIQEC